MKKTITTSIAALTAFTLVNCAPQNNLQRDAAIGGGAGALIGGIIGNNTGDGNSARGALIGGALGAATGAAVGNNKDLQQGNGYTLNKQNQYAQPQPVYPQAQY